MKTFTSEQFAILQIKIKIAQALAEIAETVDNLANQVRYYHENKEVSDLSQDLDGLLEKIEDFQFSNSLKPISIA